MAGLNFTNDHLLDMIRRRCSMPNSQPLFDSDSLLAFCDEEMQTVIFPIIMSIGGSYFVTNHDVAMTSVSEKIYPIPSDAVGLKIKDCYWLDTDGHEHEMTLLTIYDVTNQFSSGWVGLGFYLENNNVILSPQAQPGTTLRMKYYKRASKLVQNNQGGIITAIDTNTNEVTLDNLPITWTTTDTVCCIDQNPGFNTLVSEITISNIATPVITVSSVDEMTVGNWICLTGESTIAQITPEAQPILAQAVACKCLEALGDPNIATAQQKFQQVQDFFIKSLTPRVDGQMEKIVNRTGTLVFNNWSRWGWW